MHLFTIALIQNPRGVLFSQTSEQAPQREPVISPSPFLKKGKIDREHVAAILTFPKYKYIIIMSAVVTNSPHSVRPLGGHSARTITYYGHGIRRNWVCLGLNWVCFAGAGKRGLL